MRDPANTQRKRVLETVTTNQIVGDWTEFLWMVSEMGANITSKKYQFLSKI